MKNILLGIIPLMLLASCGNDDGFQRFDDYVSPDPVRLTFPIKEIEKTNSMVDILWVIDNSGSMNSIQNNVIRNTNLFMREFDKKGGINWKMGLISTSESERPFLGFSTTDGFNYRTPDRVTIFSQSVRSLGTNGSYVEKTFTPVMEKLQVGNIFLREKALSIIISITDVHEQSNVTPREFKDFLFTLKGDIQKVKFYGVYGADDMGCNGEGRWNYKGSAYEEIVKYTGGSVFPTCSADFGKKLTEIAKEIISYIKSSKIVLKKRPKPETIKVSYRGVQLPGGLARDGGMWYYNFNDNAIVFYSLDFAPGNQESVVIKFDEDDGY